MTNEEAVPEAFSSGINGLILGAVAIGISAIIHPPIQEMGLAIAVPFITAIIFAVSRFKDEVQDRDE